ncbi:hypothetical protein BP6252_10911 [Coleophoma cylindrospora]|uniref:non-specific serine/threonine protein kinase n=1 Tax=Coleophoma cylindrospora TaxID=1849047 RepID=A0A3D8QNG2_9HELO|nr:hypothetical protein BP6252_10911 [Coleophoma cylindrospora]
MALEIRIPIEPWERKIIDNVREQCPVIDSVYTESVFNSWAWATHVRSVIHAVLADRAADVGSGHRTWQALHHQLSTRGAPHSTPNSYSCHSRLDNLLRENTDLEKELRKLDAPFDKANIIFVPAKKDLVYWNAIASLRDSILPFQQCDKLSKNVQYGFHDAVEAETIKRQLEELTEKSLQRHTRIDDFDNVSTDEDILALPGQFHIWQLAKEALRQCRQGHHSTRPSDLYIEINFADPESFAWKIEYIPTSQLQMPHGLTGGSIVLWEPQPSILLDHCLFTEDEVYGFCIDQPRQFGIDDYWQGNSLIFVAKEVEYSALTQPRKHLQTLYNDCAFTLDPESKTPYLLETRPGRKFRQITKEFGLQAARANFRAPVDKIRLSRKLCLKEILQGVNPNISWVGEEKYEGMIDAIPFDELIFTGQIEDGDVFFGSWRPKVKKLVMSELQETEVVLKRIWPANKRHTKIAIRELKNTIAAFATQPIGSIRFCGVTSIPSTYQGVMTPGSVFLVFERAEKLEKYLAYRLSGVPDDWDTITELFRDLASSLGSLHMAGDPIIHRDLHKDNVVIQQQLCPNDPYDSSYPELVIIDLGESQRKDSDPQAINMYGNSDYWAPEVAKDKDYSEKSDIFAAGYVMVEVMRQRCDISKMSLVPKPLWDLVHKCLARAPHSRPNANDLEREVDDMRHTYFVLPQTVSKGNRGRVVFPDDVFVDFEAAVVAWRKSLNYESNSEDDIPESP